MSSNYEQRHLTEKHRRAAGFGGTLPLFRKHMEAQLNMREDAAKLATTPQPDMFTLPVRSTVKKSVWAEDEVNRALCDNLIDEQLLGNDYTVTATRQQVASIFQKLFSASYRPSIEACGSFSTMCSYIFVSFNCSTIRIQTGPPWLTARLAYPKGNSADAISVAKLHNNIHCTTNKSKNLLKQLAFAS